jgi:putative ubiquitin-RnfH superfamily antitoxin RatB of RatAB toxin-antitoxin module
MVDTNVSIGGMQETMDVQVCYASTQKITVIQLNVRSDSSIRDVIEISQILMKCPEVDIGVCKVGIFGKLKALSAIVQQGDRVEIYRPLTADPMEARRRRSAKQSRIIICSR